MRVYLWLVMTETALQYHFGDSIQQIKWFANLRNQTSPIHTQNLISFSLWK